MTDLSPMGFRKTPFTRELPTAHRFPLAFQAEAADALGAAVTDRMSCSPVPPAGPGQTPVSNEKR